MSPFPNGHLQPRDWFDEESTPHQVDSVIEFLTQQGTFRFPRLANGLFPAASGVGEEFEATGYRNVWVRDNVHVAFAHFCVGDFETSIACIRSLKAYFWKHRVRMIQILEEPTRAQDPMQRPHIRFHGEDLRELPEKWAHAQNDALGYFLWISVLLFERGFMEWDESSRELVSLFVRYFEAIRYWEDEDSGHWEETRKVSASSIGIVVAGLESLQRWWKKDPKRVEEALEGSSYPYSIAALKNLVDVGRDALIRILPSESIDENASRSRRYDAALLFLCYPMDILDRVTEDRILRDVDQHLQGPFGIRRYLGDSYWCADYKEHLDAAHRSIDFSDHLAERDRLLKPGFEAQWCIFNPMISAAYGRRYQADHRTKNPLAAESFKLQLAHLRISLSQLTQSHHTSGPYRCPESYFCSRGEWIPNDITPLLWTQGNLLQSLWWFKNSLNLRQSQSG